LRDRQQALAIDEAIAQNRRAAARYLPTLQAEGNAIVWDDELVLSLGGSAPPDLPAPATPYEEVVAGLVGNLSTPSTIRNQITANVQVSIVQPLIQLYPIHLNRQLTEVGVEAAKLERQALGQALAFNAATLWLQVQLTDNLLENALISKAELEAQAERVETLVQAGAAVRADLLRLQVAVANAQRDIIRLTNTRASALAQLALLMNRNLDSTATLADLDASGEPPSAGGTLTEAIDTGLNQRIELEVLDAQSTQARLSRDLTRTEMFPELTLIGAYQRTEGQGLANQDQLFAGLFMTWSIFEWGSRSHAVDAAQTRMEQLDVGRQQLRQQIELDIRNAWLELDTARASWSVSNTAVAQAEAVYRNERLRFDQGASTTVDLIASESELTRTRNARSIAWTNAAVALARMRFTTGAPITAQTVLMRHANPGG
ncbi:MAG: TolC family protein, partial [Myxococcota bacterium]